MADNPGSEASNTCEAEDCFGGPVFEPRLYIQRYYFVQQQLRKHNVTNVVDFGSAECKISRFLVRVPTLEKISLVDLDRDVLEGGRWAIRPHAGDFLQRRERLLTVQIYCGSVANVDRAVVGCDAVSMVEIIEHLHPDVLAAACDTVFGDLQPRVVVMTTPNADFNVLFPGFSGFRHWDHKFEWTRQEFQEWCAAITDQYPYSVEFDGIGDPPEDFQHLGHCSQAAIFVRRSDTPRSESSRVTKTYELIAESKYPHRKLLAMSEEDSLLMELQYLVQQYVRASRTVHHVENTEWVEDCPDHDTESNLPCNNQNNSSDLPCNNQTNSGLQHSCEGNHQGDPHLHHSCISNHQNSPQIHYCCIKCNSGVNGSSSDSSKEDYFENQPSQNCRTSTLAGECKVFGSRHCDDLKGNNSDEPDSQHICGSDFETTCDCMQIATGTPKQKELGCKGSNTSTDSFCVKCKGNNYDSGRYSPQLQMPDCVWDGCTNCVLSSSDHDQYGFDTSSNSSRWLDQDSQKSLTYEEKHLINVAQTIKPDLDIQHNSNLISVQQVNTKENTTSNNTNVSENPKQSIHCAYFDDPSLDIDFNKCMNFGFRDIANTCRYSSPEEGTDVDKIMNISLGTDVDSLIDQDLGTDADQLRLADDDSGTPENDGDDVVLIPINSLLRQKQIKDKLDENTIRDFLLDHGFTLSKDQNCVVWRIEDDGERFPGDETEDEDDDDVVDKEDNLVKEDRESIKPEPDITNCAPDQGYTTEYWD